MLFQLSPEFHLCSIFPGGPIVSQNEVGMHAVENSEFAHRIGHGLIWPDNLQDFKGKRQKSEKREQHFIYLFIFSLMYFLIYLYC